MKLQARRLLCVMGAVALSACVPAYAASTDTIQLPTVIVTGSASYQNLYGENSDPSILAIRAGPYYGLRYVNWEFYSEYKLFAAEAKLNPASTPDVRCNIGATQQTRATTSRAALTDRFLAAQQLFASIRGYDGGASLRGLLKGNASYLYNGTRQFTFQITYADGGKEGWIVASVLTEALVAEGNVPGSLVPGDGTVKSCGTKG